MTRYIFNIALGTLMFLSCQNSQSYEGMEYESEAQKAVSQWIMSNAKYPKSYSPISFDSFEYISFSDFTDKTSDFFIVLNHKYTLKDKNGDLRNQNDYFTLDDNLRMSLIQDMPGSMLSHIPPSTFIWSNIFADTIIHVHTGGLTKEQFNTRYRDWKFLNQMNLQYEDFEYCDSFLGQHYFLNPSQFDNQQFAVKRVLEITISSTTELDDIGLHELGRSLSRLVSEKQTIQIPIFVSDNTSVEEYGFVKIDSVKNKVTLRSINTEKEYCAQIKLD